MRIAVIGTGGTGGLLGGMLARAGEDVSFIARGRHLQAILNHGMTVKSRMVGDFVVAPATVTDDPRSVGPVDLVLFCVKAYDTEPAAEAIAPMVDTDTVILSVQNGVDNEERIGSIVGHDHVLGATARLSAVLEEPGVVAERGAGAFIRLGEMHGGVSERVRHIREVLENAGIEAEALADVRVALWEKFLFICALSGVTSLTRLPMGPIRNCRETWALFRSVMEEVAAVARAEKVSLSDDAVDRWMAFSSNVPADMYGSMYQDLVAGRRMELDYLNGTVVRLGAAHDIPTPMNFAILAALKPYANGKSPLE